MEDHQEEAVAADEVVRLDVVEGAEKGVGAAVEEAVVEAEGVVVTKTMTTSPMHRRQLMIMIMMMVLPIMRVMTLALTDMATTLKTKTLVPPLTISRWLNRMMSVIKMASRRLT